MRIPLSGLPSLSNEVNSRTILIAVSVNKEFSDFYQNTDKNQLYLAKKKLIILYLQIPLV